MLNQTRNRRYFAAVWTGVGLAVAASALLGAALLVVLGGLSGTRKEAVEGFIMFAAAGVLTYVLWWLGRHSRTLASSLQADAQAALDRSSRFAILAVVFLAVFREGAETALYLAAAAGTSPWPQVTGGAATGFVAAAAVGYGAYRGGSRVLDVRVFFRVTTVVLLAFAAGMVARATLAFQAAGLFPGTITLWDVGGLLPETEGAGAVLRALLGYTAAPSLLQLIFWLAYVALVLALSLEVGARRSVRDGPALLPIGRSYDHPLYRLVRRPRLTTVLPAAVGVLLLALLVTAFLGTDVGPFDNRGPLSIGPFEGRENEDSLFNFVMWIVWLPLLTLVTALVGRVWCGNLCPLRLVAEWTRSVAERVRGRGAATSPTMRLGWLLPTAFIIVTFLVKWWPVQRVARYGAFLFVIVLALAVVVGLVFRRGTWCRYVCPVGGWLARIARLSPLALRPDAEACASCSAKPCVTGTVRARSCPAYLNPSRLETNQHCLSCWACVANCPAERASLKLGWRPPGAELLKPSAPNLWESVFVASLLGMYMAVGHRSPELARLPWPLVFFALVLGATVFFAGVCSLAARLAGISIRRALTTFGYIFLPLEFGTAVIAFGDDALEFLGIAQPAAALLLTVGFVWSVVLGVSILRNQTLSGPRAVAGAVPLAAALVTILFVWLQWYAGGPVVDVT